MRSCEALAAGTRVQSRRDHRVGTVSAPPANNYQDQVWQNSGTDLWVAFDSDGGTLTRVAPWTVQPLGVAF